VYRWAQPYYWGDLHSQWPAVFTARRYA